MNSSKKKKVLLILIILIILIWAPWMTDNWCKRRLFGREFDSLGPINESWKVDASWIPFGRCLKVRRPEAEQPKIREGDFLVTGGYGFDICMVFSGNTFFFVGR